MGIKLFGTRILVEKFEQEKSNDLEKTKGGIYMVKTVNPMERLNKGIVKYVGDDCEKVKVGDEIIFDAVQPAPFIVDDITFEMVDESAIIGVTSE
jgi:co-chaperonin GroES (HSP10)